LGATPTFDAHFRAALYMECGLRRVWARESFSVRAFRLMEVRPIVIGIQAMPTISFFVGRFGKSVLSSPWIFEKSDFEAVPSVCIDSLWPMASRSAWESSPCWKNMAPPRWGYRRRSLVDVAGVVTSGTTVLDGERGLLGLATGLGIGGLDAGPSGRVGAVPGLEVLPSVLPSLDVALGHDDRLVVEELALNTASVRAVEDLDLAVAVGVRSDVLALAEIPPPDGHGDPDPAVAGGHGGGPWRGALRGRDASAAGACGWGTATRPMTPWRGLRYGIPEVLVGRGYHVGGRHGLAGLLDPCGVQGRLETGRSCSGTACMMAWRNDPGFGLPLMGTTSPVRFQGPPWPWSASEAIPDFRRPIRRYRGILARNGVFSVVGPTLRTSERST
jgi:hypothetical protein